MDVTECVFVIKCVSLSLELCFNSNFCEDNFFPLAVLDKNSKFVDIIKQETSVLFFMNRFVEGNSTVWFRAFFRDLFSSWVSKELLIISSCLSLFKVATDWVWGTGADIEDDDDVNIVVDDEIIDFDETDIDDDNKVVVIKDDDGDNTDCNDVDETTVVIVTDEYVIDDTDVGNRDDKCNGNATGADNVPDTVVVTENEFDNDSDDGSNGDNAVGGDNNDVDDTDSTDPKEFCDNNPVVYVVTEKVDDADSDRGDDIVPKIDIEGNDVNDEDGCDGGGNGNKVDTTSKLSLLFVILVALRSLRKESTSVLLIKLSIPNFCSVGDFPLVLGYTLLFNFDDFSICKGNNVTCFSDFFSFTDFLFSFSNDCKQVATHFSVLAISFRELLPICWLWLVDNLTFFNTGAGRIFVTKTTFVKGVLWFSKIGPLDTASILHGNIKLTGYCFLLPVFAYVTEALFGNVWKSTSSFSTREIGIDAETTDASELDKAVVTFGKQLIASPGIGNGTTVWLILGTVATGGETSVKNKSGRETGKMDNVDEKGNDDATGGQILAEDELIIDMVGKAAWVTSTLVKRASATEAFGNFAWTTLGIGTAAWLQGTTGEAIWRILSDDEVAWVIKLVGKEVVIIETDVTKDSCEERVDKAVSLADNFTVCSRFFVFMHDEVSLVASLLTLPKLKKLHFRLTFAFPATWLIIHVSNSIRFFK